MVQLLILPVYACIKNFPAGLHTIVVSMVGYEEKEISLNDTPISSAPQVILLHPKSALMNEVTIMATRNNSRLENLPTNVEVLGMEEIDEESGIKPGSITSLLGDIAGIQMQQSSATSGNVSARIQGLHGRYTQILRDGMPLYGGFSGSFSLLQIPPLDLRQVEIIKGSSSTLYGGDAISGIINLVSRKPGRIFETSLLLNQTSLKESDVNAFISGYYKETGYTMFAGYVSQNYVDVNHDTYSDVPRLKNFVVHPKLFFVFDGNISLSAGITSTFESREGGDVFAIQNGANAFHPYFVKHIAFRHSGEYEMEKKYDDGSSLVLKGAVNFMDRSIENMQYDFQATQFLRFSELSYYSKGTKSDNIFGFNFSGNTFHNLNAMSISVADNSETTWGAFVQNDFRISEKFLLESGVRFDYNTKYSSFLLPRLAVMYKLSPLCLFRLNGGYGYKIPDLFSYIDEERDLDKITSYSVKPELSKNVNFDVNYNIPIDKAIALTVDQSFFYTQLNHPVTEKTDAYGKIYLHNEDRPVETFGAQTYSRLVIDEIEFYLSYVYTHATKKYDSQNSLFYATPKHNAACIMLFDLEDGWRTGTDVSYIGNQIIENNEKTPAYVFMAIMLSKKIGSVTLVLNCENVFDYRQKNYVIPTSGIPEFKTLWAPIDGRVFNLSLNYKI